MARPSLRAVVAERFGALEHRNFRLYVIGQLISLVGTWMQSVAQSWLMHRLTGSAYWLGLLGFTQFLPVMLFSLWAGAVVDRMDKRRLLYITQGAALVQAALLATLVTTGVVRPWMVLALAGLYGIINAFDMPTRQAFVVEMVGKEDLANAIALNSTTFNSARIVGPAVAGVLLATIGEGGCFWLNAVSYVAVLWCLAQMALPRREFWRSGRALGSSLAAGVRYAWSVRPIRNLLLLLGATAGIGFQYMLLLPIYARDILRAGPQAFGLMVTAFGLGALVGSVRQTGRLERPELRYNLLIGLAASGAGLAAFAWSRALPLSLVAGGLTGFGLIVYVNSTNMLLQLTTEDRFRGRVMSLYTLMFAGTAPIGAYIAGVIGQHWGAPVATTFSAAAMLTGAVIVLQRLGTLAPPRVGSITEPTTPDRME